MYRKDTLDAIVQQEQNYKFASFDHHDAWDLGNLIVKGAKDFDRPIATKIILDDLDVFAYFAQGTNEDNNRWLLRKTNTVKRIQMASLHVAVLKELGQIKDEPWLYDEYHYALCGGGFPLVVGESMRGVLLVSGLPHLKDHAYLTSQIAKFLGKEIIEVPVFDV